jgi:multidrug resistance efflux pump
MKTTLSPKLVTWSAVVIAIALALAFYARYLTKPWTRDGQVRANIVGVACRVDGPVISIPLKDNEYVKKGNLLFEIDPSTYQAALDDANAQKEEATATLTQATQELARQTQLYATQVNDLRDLQNAQDVFASAKAVLAAAKANVESAALSLSYTKIFAPVNGYITNMNTSPGTYVYAGQQLIALVDTDSFWVAAYFKETQLNHITQGHTARIALMGHAGTPFEGIVESVGWAIFLTDGATVELLPQIAQTVDWIRLPQRFPVRIRVTGTPPVPLRLGLTASVAVSPGPAVSDER